MENNKLVLDVETFDYNMNYITEVGVIGTWQGAQARQWYNAKFAEFWKLGSFCKNKPTPEVAVDFRQILADLDEICAVYNVRQIIAYNATFDKRKFSETAAFQGIDLANYPDFQNVEWIDLWNIAANSFMNTDGYKGFCLDHGFYTDKGNISTNAETAYRFITDNPDFEETHIAVEDILIELEIYKYCQQFENLKTSLNGMAWKAPNKGIEEKIKAKITVELDGVDKATLAKMLKLVAGG